jgi:hypothetical protein
VSDDKFPELQMVELTWLDSVSNVGQTWFDLQEFEDEVKRMDAETMVSIGFLVRETDKFVFLACSIHRDDGITQIGRLSMIPAACVIHRRVLV